MEGGGSDATEEITGLLLDWRRGKAGAANQLFPLVYRELRALAHGLLRRGGRPRTLETTSLVHDAYVKLVDHSRVDLNDRHHFLAVAAMAMRHIVVDRARAKGAKKRGGGRIQVELDDGARAVDARAEEVLAINQALIKLEGLDPRLARIVEMRFFGGLSVEETARALATSERTVKRDWQKARAFLLLELLPSPRS